MNHRRSSSTMSNDGGRITLDEAAWLSGGSSEFSATDEQEQEPGWRSPQITPIGHHYPLGPNRVSFPASQLQKTLETLPGTFKRLSLDATYCEAPICASLRSIEEVALCVCLYESRRDPSQIILEVTRQAGDTIIFHSYAREILADVSGQTTKAATTRTACVWTTRTATLPQPRKTDEETVLSALELAYNMLKTDRYDAQRLGLESLIHMSDPNKSGTETAKIVAETLLSPAGPVQERLSRTLIAFACEDAQELDESDPFYCRAVQLDFGYLALVCLSHVFAVASPSTTRSFLDSGTNLVDSLLRTVHDSKSHPHEAYFAVQCLTALCALLPELSARIKHAAGDVRSAERYGDLHHLALAQASHRLLVALRA